jgi:hypothetical protein
MNENDIKHVYFLWHGVLLTPEELKDARESEE